MKVQVNFEMENDLKKLVEKLAEQGDITVKQFINNAIIDNTRTTTPTGIPQPNDLILAFFILSIIFKYFL